MDGSKDGDIFRKPKVCDKWVFRQGVKNNRRTPRISLEALKLFDVPTDHILLNIVSKDSIRRICSSDIMLAWYAIVATIEFLEDSDFIYFTSSTRGLFHSMKKHIVSGIV